MVLPMPLWKLRRTEAIDTVSFCFRAAAEPKVHRPIHSYTRSRLSVRRVCYPARTANYAIQVRENIPLRKQLKDEAKTKRIAGPDRASNSAIEDHKLKDWELTVGIEIHAQLNTARKLFSREYFMYSTSEAKM